MDVLVIYDSAFGNTERIARAVGEALKSEGDVEVLQVGDVNIDRLSGLRVLVVGSPTRQFRPLPAVTGFLRKLPGRSLEGVRAAAFDTRISVEDIREESVFLAFMARVFGYAARPVAGLLRKKGAVMAVPPEGFLVGGMEGPLKEGELERAREWAVRIGAVLRSDMER